MTPPTTEDAIGPADTLRMIAEQLRLLFSRFIGATSSPRTEVPAQLELKAVTPPAATVAPVSQSPDPIEPQPRSDGSQTPDVVEIRDLYPSSRRDAVSLLAAAPLLATRALELRNRRGRRRSRSLSGINR